MRGLSTFHLPLRLTKMLVIDAQNDVCDDNSAYANSEYAYGKKRDVKPLQEAIERGIIPFLERARKHHLPIGFIQSVYQLGQYSSFGISDRWLTLDLELEDPNWRIKIYRNMPVNGEPIFLKDTQETFKYRGEENGLANWLQGTEHVLVSGFTTDGCIKKCVCALLERGYKPIVFEDCVAVSGHKMRTAHITTLNEYRNHEVVRVINSTKVEF